MSITLQLRPAVARVLHQRGPPTAESQALLRLVTTLGVVLKPIHPGTDDPHLAPYFTVEVPDAAITEEVVAQLRHCPAVEAAYVKPPDALP